MHTEDDLRSALTAFADAHEPDEQQVLSRLGWQADTPFNVEQSPARRIRHRPTVAVAASIVVVLLLAIGAYVGYRKQTDENAEHDGTSHGLRVLGGLQFPGTTVIATFHGSGSTVLSLPHLAKPSPNYEYGFVLTCGGHKTVKVVGLLEFCGYRSSGGETFHGVPTRVAVDAGSTSTTWHLVVLLEPDTQSNAYVIAYTNSLFVSGSNGKGDGRGDGEIRVHGPTTGPTTDASYDIDLTCSGTGVTVTSTKPTPARDYTRTCFAGWTYEWRIPRRSLPNRLTVSASTSTTWSIAITALP